MCRGVCRGGLNLGLKVRNRKHRALLGEQTLGVCFPEVGGEVWVFCTASCGEKLANKTVLLLLTICYITHMLGLLALVCLSPASSPASLHRLLLRSYFTSTC